MRQALHIFHKDARRFRYEIAVSIAFTAAFACSQIFSGLLPSFLHLATSALPVIWWPLICLLIQQEPLIGDRQFWITRPYSRRSLLAAKALFIVTFISVPLLLAQSAILMAEGFQPLAYLPSFLWLHAVLFASVLLPAVALAYATRSFGQAVLTFFGVVAVVIVMTVVTGNSDGGAAYIASNFRWAGTLTEEASYAAVALLVLILQWTTRTRWFALIAGAALYLLVGSFSDNLTTTLGTTVQSRMFGERGTEQTAVMMNGADVGRSDLSARDTVPIHAGFRVVDMPAGLLAKPEIIEMTFEDSRGARWSSGWIPVMNGEVFQRDPDPDATFAWSQRINVDRQFAQRVGSAPLTVHGSVWVMLNARRGVDLPDNRRTLMPDGSACTVYKQSPRPSWFVYCASPFHATFSSSDSFTAPAEPNKPMRGTTRLLSFWDSPLPTTFALSPLSANGTGGVGAQTKFLYFYYEPRAYIRRYFTATNVRLP